MAGGLHADDHLVLRLGDALKPRDAPLEPLLGVLEGHRLRGLLASLAYSADHVVCLGDIHTCIDHRGHLLSPVAMVGPLPCPSRTATSQKRHEVGIAPSSS